MRKKEERAGKPGGPLLNMLLGGVGSAICCLGLLAAAAVLISAGAVGEESAFLVIAAACLIGCFVGGRFAVRRTAGRRSLVGFGSAAFFLVLLIVIGFLCMDGMKLSGEGLVFALCSMAGGGLSGAFGGKAKKKRRK